MLRVLLAFWECARFEHSGQERSASLGKGRRASNTRWGWLSKGGNGVGATGGEEELIRRTGKGYRFQLSGLGFLLLFSSFGRSRSLLLVMVFIGVLAACAALLACFCALVLGRLFSFLCKLFPAVRLQLWVREGK